MKRFHIGFLLVLACLLMVTAGCSPKYKITDQLSESVDTGARCHIGEITDGLPADTDIDDRPGEEDIAKLRDFLAEEVLNRGQFTVAGTDVVDAEYRIEGTILDFSKGSGAVRFLIGFGAGNADLTVRLQLVQVASGKVLFAGNFKQTVSSWGESGEQTFRRVAKDFAKELWKEHSKLAAPQASL